MDLTLLKEKQSLEPIAVTEFTSLVNYNIYEFDLSHAINSKEIEQYVYETQAENPISLGEFYDKSNVKAWHSSWFTHLKTEKFNKLSSIIIEACKKIYCPKHEEPNIYDLQIRELWTIIYKENNFTGMHHHGQNNKVSISLVYFAYADENATPLKFHINKGNNETFDVIPKTGHFICFPSFALHSVPRIKPNEKRICVAANLSLIRISEDPNIVHKDDPNYKRNINAG